MRAPGLDETFDMEQFTRWRLMEGLDDIGLTLRHTDEIDAYEAARARLVALRVGSTGWSSPRAGWNRPNGSKPRV